MIRVFDKIDMIAMICPRTTEKRIKTTIKDKIKSSRQVVRVECYNTQNCWAVTANSLVVLVE